MEGSRVRIGEVAHRTGVAVSTLRAWERRYGLLDPVRTEGGHRLYSRADIARVRRVTELLEDGWSAGAAAREVRRLEQAAPATEESGSPAETLRTRLELAFDHFDAGEADATLDDVLARLEIGTALDEVVLPALRWVAEGWETDPRVIAREHFATNAIRPRLLRLARRPASSARPVAVAAAPEHEHHDLGLLAAASVATERGWQVHVLGARTPSAALARASSELGASLVLLAALDRAPAEAFLADLPDLEDATVILGGAGFRHEDTERVPRSIRHDRGMRELGETLDRIAAELVSPAS